MRLFRNEGEKEFHKSDFQTLVPPSQFSWGAQVIINATFESWCAFLDFCGEHRIHVVRRVPHDSPHKMLRKGFPEKLGEKIKNSEKSAL